MGHIGSLEYLALLKPCSLEGSDLKILLNKLSIQQASATRWTVFVNCLHRMNFNEV